MRRNKILSEQDLEANEAGAYLIVDPADRSVARQVRQQKSSEGVLEQRRLEIETLQEREQELYKRIDGLEAEYNEMLKVFKEERAKQQQQLQSERQAAEARAAGQLAEIKKAGAEQAQALVKKAEQEAEALVAKATLKRDELEAAQQNAFNAGVKKGIARGEKELETLKTMLHRIFSKTLQQREHILRSSEKELIRLALLIAKKVVKKISQSDQKLVLRNLLAAIRRLGEATKLTIRVNTLDLAVTELFREQLEKLLVKDFAAKQKQGESLIEILEDPSVERGGCLVESDFSLIDARLSSQLAEVELAVEKVVPLRTAFGESSSLNALKTQPNPSVLPVS